VLICSAKAKREPDEGGLHPRGENCVSDITAKWMTLENVEQVPLELREGCRRTSVRDAFDQRPRASFRKGGLVDPSRSLVQQDVNSLTQPSYQVRLFMNSSNRRSRSKRSEEQGEGTGAERGSGGNISKCRTRASNSSVAMM